MYCIYTTKSFIIYRFQKLYSVNLNPISKAENLQEYIRKDQLNMTDNQVCCADISKFGIEIRFAST